MYLKIPLRLTLRELEEGLRLTRGHKYWPRRILGELHAYGFLFAGVTGACYMLLSKSAFQDPDMRFGSLACFGFAILLLGLPYLGRRHALRQNLARLHAGAASASLSEQGIATGGYYPTPWAFYKRAILSPSVLVLIPTMRKGKPQVLPVSSLDGADREALFEILITALGRTQTERAPAHRLRLRPDVTRTR